MTTKTDDADRELLELAARAALGRTSIPDQHVEMVRRGWNPLRHDEDALRLAVRLYMHVKRETGQAIVEVDHNGQTYQIIEPFRAVDQGEFIGTRRAIVRAAAEIERNKL